MTAASTVDSKSTSDIIKLVGIGAVSIGLNYLIFGKLLKSQQKNQQPRRLKQQLITQILYKQKSEIQLLSSKKQIKPLNKELEWGSVKLIGQKNQDPLLKQLKIMDSLLCEVSRINHLIVDLQLTDFKPNTNPLIAQTIKKTKGQPFMAQQTLVSPGQFVIKQCKFTPGITLELERKYMRAGPRASQFFKYEQIRADIVCLGNVCPGMNTVIRELTLMLVDIYKVNKVVGVKNGFKGYYDRKFMDLNPNVVETIHHFGGCFLGLCQSQFKVNKIIDSLIQRNINQVYLIGANTTMKACSSLHKQIKKRKLPIAICVILKGINRDVPIFDNCFGFQTAVEESSKIIEKAYAFSHSNQRGISLVKLPGYKSGFLASHAVLSTVNANICLVPEFQYDIYGANGLLAAILWRIKNKGSCTIVYAEGSQKSIRDCCIKQSRKQQTITHYDNFLKQQIEIMMKNQNLLPYQIGVFNGVYASRSAPANSLDTKLCCQIAQSSIMGVMAGYTNFAIGHLANKSAMISVNQLISSESVTQLKQYDEIWQQTIMSTGQPPLLNEKFTLRTQ